MSDPERSREAPPGRSGAAWGSEPEEGTGDEAAYEPGWYRLANQAPVGEEYRVFHPRARGDGGDDAAVTPPRRGLDDLLELLVGSGDLDTRKAAADAAIGLMRQIGIDEGTLSRLLLLLGRAGPHELPDPEVRARLVEVIGSPRLSLSLEIPDERRAGAERLLFADPAEAHAVTPAGIPHVDPSAVPGMGSERPAHVPAEAAVAEREAAVADREAAILGREAALRGLEAELEARGDSLARHDAALRGREGDLEAARAALAEREAEGGGAPGTSLDEREAALVEREAELAERKSAVVEREAELDARGAALAERESALERGAPDAEAIEAALGDDDPKVREAVVRRATAGLGDAMDRALVRAFLDDDPGVRDAAAGHLDHLPDRMLWHALAGVPPERRDVLLEAVERSDPGRVERVAAARALADEPDVRLLALDVLSRLGAPRSSAAIRTALGDPSPEVRRAALRTARTLQPSLALDALTGALTDPLPEVRADAVQHLLGLDHDAAIPVLVAALRDPDDSVRAEAGEGLAGWTSPEVARHLISAMREPDLRGPAIHLLRRLGPVSLEAVLEAIPIVEPVVATQLGQLLGALGGEALMEEPLASTDPDRRVRAVEALGAMGTSEAVRMLIGSLAHPDPRLRARAVEVMGRTGGDHVLEALESAFLGDPVPDVAAAAGAVLQRIGALDPHGAEPGRERDDALTGER